MNNYVESLGKMIKALHTHLTTVFAPKEVHIVQTMQSTPKEGDVLISYSTSIEAEGFHNTITYEERDVEGTPTLFMQDNRQDELMLKFVAYDRETVDGVAVNIAEEVYDWFYFYGVEELSALKMSVRKISQVNNEDITLLDFTERRRSVSVRIGVTKMIEREVAAIASVGPVEVN